MISIEKVTNGFLVTSGGGQQEPAKYVCLSYAEVDVRVRVMLKELTAVEAQFELDKIQKKSETSSKPKE